MENNKKYLPATENEARLIEKNKKLIEEIKQLERAQFSSYISKTKNLIFEYYKN